MDSEKKLFEPADYAPASLLTELEPLKQDGTYHAQSTARKIIRQSVGFREIDRTAGSLLERWTYSWAFRPAKD